MAIRLRAAGIDSFVVLEQAGEVGGTWRDNTYPGCACDIPSHLYSLSFAPKTDWSRMYPTQPEIREYLNDCVRRFDLASRIRLNTRFEEAVFDETAGIWNVRTHDGTHDGTHDTTFSARFVISAFGGLSRPAIPALFGIENFEGPAFHSARWNHELDLAGKRVAVIGTGASAIQFVPEIATQVAQLDVYQRTAPWVLPKLDRSIGPRERSALARVPGYRLMWRWFVYWRQELLAFGFTVNVKLLERARRMGLHLLRRQIASEELRARLTPDYMAGCKRILISNDYFPAVSRPNVSVTTTGIARIEEDAVITTDGVRHPADCLIFGTGFQVADPFPAGVVRGRGGIDIVDTWRDGAHAYLGTSLPGYPNFFMIVGPNTGLGHNSMVFMIESQVEYILRALKTMQAERAAAIEVRAQVERSYNEQIQRKLGRAIWSTGGCKSWYLDPKTGRNTTLWPGFAYKFRQATSTFSMDDYLAYAPAPQASTQAGTEASPQQPAHVHGNAAATSAQAS
jgi:cation diffusion facilitator CzcD-associated flavoprotein CzcO